MRALRVIMEKADARIAFVAPGNPGYAMVLFLERCRDADIDRPIFAFRQRGCTVAAPIVFFAVAAILVRNRPTNGILPPAIRRRRVRLTRGGLFSRLWLP